jgi:hypothetical protein
MAPGAKIAFFDIGNSKGDLSVPRDERLLLGTGRPYAKIHSASWGSKHATYYDSRT